MILIITYLVMNLVRIYVIYLFIDTMLYKKRVSDPVILWAYGIYYCISAFLYLRLHHASLYILSNLVFGFIMGLLYQSNYTRKILASVFVCSLSLACDSFAFISTDFLLKASDNKWVCEMFYITLDIILSIMSLLLLVIIIRPLLRNQDINLPISYELSVFLIPSGSIYILYVLSDYYVANITDNLSFIWVAILILFCINISVFFLYNKLLKEENIKHENIMLHHQNSIYEKQALLIEEFQNNLHDQKHDLKNHLLAIKEYAECGKINELIPYIDSLIGINKEISAIITTGNLTIDAMLNSKLHLAGHQDTHLHTQVKLMAPLIMINPVDLTIILGNLLDNALEACTQIPPEQRNIYFYLCYQHDFLLIQVKNRYNPFTTDIREGKAYTTKDNKKLHGIGLRRIKQTAEKYNGSFEYNTTNNRGESFFVAEVGLYPE